MKDTGRLPASPGLLDLDPVVFRQRFPREPFLVRHHLERDERLGLPSLIRLAQRLPERNVEYNAGTVDINMYGKETPRTGLSIPETIRRIEECSSWMVLKNVEADAEYRALLHECLEVVRPLSEPLDPGMETEEGFIFISSPGARTPYHSDPEHNFLLQVRGSKQIHIWDPTDRSVLSEVEIEGQFSGHQRNLTYRAEYEMREKVFPLSPGLGLHFPVSAPHWVQNGDQVSISFSITFRTPATERRGLVYAGNAMLRKLGMTPTPFGRWPARDAVVYNAMRVQRRLRRLVRSGK